MKNPEDEAGKRDKSLPAWARAAAMGSELAGAIVAGTLVGYWIDTKFQTSPKGVLIGSLVGIGGGFYNFIRRAYRITKDQERARKANQQRSGENERQDGR